MRLGGLNFIILESIFACMLVACTRKSTSPEPAAQPARPALALPAEIKKYSERIFAQPETVPSFQNESSGLQTRSPSSFLAEGAEAFEPDSVELPEEEIPVPSPAGDQIEVSLRMGYGLVRTTAADGSVRQMASRPSPTFTAATSLGISSRWRARLEANLRKYSFEDAVGVTTDGSRGSSWSALAGAEWQAAPMLQLRALAGFGEAFALSSTGNQTQRLSRATRTEARVSARVRILEGEKGSLFSENFAARTFAGKGGMGASPGFGYGLGLKWARDTESLIGHRAIGVEFQKFSNPSAAGKTTDFQLHLGLTLGLNF